MNKKGLIGAISLLIFFYILGFFTSYFYFRYRSRKIITFIRNPLKVYANFTVLPLTETGVIGVIEKEDFKRVLEVEDISSLLEERR